MAIHYMMIVLLINVAACRSAVLAPGGLSAHSLYTFMLRSTPAPPAPVEGVVLQANSTTSICDPATFAYRSVDSANATILRIDIPICTFERVGENAKAKGISALVFFPEQWEDDTTTEFPGILQSRIQ
jgi:hypothetical protein